MIGVGSCPENSGRLTRGQPGGSTNRIDRSAAKRHNPPGRSPFARGEGPSRSRRRNARPSFRVDLIVSAVVVRAAAVLVLQSHTVPHSTYEHGEIAANLLAGRGFSVKFLGADGPTSQQAPVYPWIVAGAYALGGVETPRSLLILELGQAVLGGFLVVGVLWLAREVAPGWPWVARAAGVIAALHPTLVYSATHVQVASLAATLLTFSLASAYRTGRVASLLCAFQTGLWLTVLTLTDPILGLSAVGVCWAVIVGCVASVIRQKQGIHTNMTGFHTTEERKPRNQQSVALAPALRGEGGVRGLSVDSDTAIPSPDPLAAKPGRGRPSSNSTGSHFSQGLSSLHSSRSRSSA